MTYIVRLAENKDLPGILDIYNFEILNTKNTFDLVPKTLSQQKQWLYDRSGVYPVLAAIEIENGREHRLAGFAALSPYRHRPAYATTVENSVYVDIKHRRRGVGNLLLENLILRAKEHGFHSIIARINSNNLESQKLHEKLNYKKIGIEIEVGRKFGKWIDIISYQKLLK
jgi:phosphinothricin acetyltransferase